MSEANRVRRRQRLTLIGASALDGIRAAATAAAATSPRMFLAFVEQVLIPAHKAAVAPAAAVRAMLQRACLGQAENLLACKGHLVPRGAQTCHPRRLRDHQSCGILAQTSVPRA